MKYKFLFYLIFFMINEVYSQVQVYVSPLPLGNDITGNGTLAKPFLTLQKAKEYVRTINSSMTQNIEVNIFPGEYLLNTTLLFDNLDSGTNGKRIIYKAYDSNNKPVISGGERVTGWVLDDPVKNIWKVNIGNKYARQLYVNGVKMTRSRSETTRDIIETKTGYLSTCYDFSTWNNIKDMEVVSMIRWRAQKIPVESVCNSQLVVNPLFWKYLVHSDGNTDFKTAPAYWLENHYKLIDKENEWYIDRITQTLYYKPVNAINSVSQLNNLDVIIPKLEKMIDGNNVSNLNFDGIIFKYSTWKKPSEVNNYMATSNNGYWPSQADANVEIGDPNFYNHYMKSSPIIGAMTFIEAKNLKIVNNEFRHIGGTAVVFGENSTNNNICNNTFNDISASAIRVGEILGDTGDSNPQFSQSKVDNISGNSISNNFIDNIANEYFGSVGIFIPYAKNTTIKNNTISHFPYTGISIGWGWNVNHNLGVNIISNNKIDCSSQILPDGGAIYTLSSQGTVNSKSQITNNYITNQKFYRGAIYLDQASCNIEIKNNVIDIFDNQSIVSSIDCVQEGVRSIEYWYVSSNNLLKDNYYNSRYLSPPNPSLPNQGCIVGPCVGNVVENNIPFNGFGNHNQNNIVINSGQIINYNCN